MACSSQLRRAMMLPALAFGVGLACPSAVQAQGYAFTRLDAPDGGRLRPASINNSGQIAGTYSAPPNLVMRSGFIFTDLTTLDTSFTWYITGINDAGDLVGNAGSPAPGLARLQIGGVLSQVDEPPGCYALQLNGINNLGDAVGTCYDSALRAVSGRERFADGRVVEILVPGATYMTAAGINDEGVIVGSMMYPGQSDSAFVRSPRTGFLEQLNVPGATWTNARGINNLGQVVGNYATPDGLDHGFLWDNGTYTSIDYPGAASTTPLGIEDSGVIVGIERDPQPGTQPFGFIAAPQ